MQDVRRLFILGLLLCCAGLSTLAYSSEPQQISSQRKNVITIVVAKDVHQDYIRYIGDRDPVTITEYGGPYARRDVIELVLFYQALRWGGFEEPTKVIEHDNIRRALRRLGQGEFTAWTAPLSRDYFSSKENILFTDPVTFEGDFGVGLFTRKNHTKALSISDLKGLRSLCVVTSRFWTDTWMTLVDLDLPCTQDASHWRLMVKMVATGRSDATLGPFLNSDDMAWEQDGYRIYPVPGVKLALKGHRYWSSSKLNPMGTVVHSHLQKGLRMLKERGLIEKAYQESGVRNPETENWKVLNAHKIDPRPRGIR